MIWREGNFSFSFFYNEQIQEKCYFLNLLITDKHSCHVTAWGVTPQPLTSRLIWLSSVCLAAVVPKSSTHRKQTGYKSNLTHPTHIHIHKASGPAASLFLFLDRSCLELTSTDKNNPPHHLSPV